MFKLSTDFKTQNIIIKREREITLHCPQRKSLSITSLSRSEKGGHGGKIQLISKKHPNPKNIQIQKYIQIGINSLSRNEEGRVRQSVFRYRVDPTNKSAVVFLVTTRWWWWRWWGWGWCTEEGQRRGGGAEGEQQWEGAANSWGKPSPCQIRQVLTLLFQKCAWCSPFNICTNCLSNCAFDLNKTISDGGITVDFWFIKVYTSNWSSNSWGSSNSWHR